MVINNEPIQLIVREEKMNSKFRLRENNINHLLTTILIADKVQFRTKLLHRPKSITLLINVTVPQEQP